MDDNKTMDEACQVKEEEDDVGVGATLHTTVAINNSRNDEERVQREIESSESETTNVIPTGYGYRVKVEPDDMEYIVRVEKIKEEKCIDVVEKNSVKGDETKQTLEDDAGLEGHGHDQVFESSSGTEDGNIRLTEIEGHEDKQDEDIISIVDLSTLKHTTLKPSTGLGKRMREDEEQGETRDSLNPPKTRKRNGDHRCNECDEIFRSSMTLARHIKSSHTRLCVVCDKSFKDKFVYEGHMREHAGEEKPYRCDICGQKFSTLEKMKKHRYVCAKKGKFECFLCGSVFSRKDNFDQHMAVHTDKNKNLCQKCDRQFSSAAVLRKHMILHTDETPFHCVVCDRGFKFKLGFDYHMRSHTGEEHKYHKLHTCDICGKVVKGLQAYRCHMDIHNGNKKYGCRICGKKFTQVSSRDGHERTHYNKTIRNAPSLSEEQLKQNIAESHDCRHCLLSFTRQVFLDSHLQSSHQEVSQKSENVKNICNECIVCEKIFQSKSEVVTHYIKSHCKILEENEKSFGSKEKKEEPRCGKQSPGRDSSGDKDSPGKLYSCDLCKMHVSRHTVSHHMRKHGVRRFVCRVCGLKFTLVTNLKRHMTLHTSENPYECVICNEKFRTREGLERHKSSHKGTPKAKSYGCDTCGKKFLDNYHLSRHQITHMKKYKCRTCRMSFVDVELYEKHKQGHEAGS